MKPWWLLVLAMLALPAAGPAGAPEGPWRDQIHWVEVRDADNQTRLLFTRICRPHTEAAARVVVINHGSPVKASARETMRPYACDSEAVRWFLTRGFVAVLPMRRGYGATGGPYAETSANCRSERFVNAARETARDIEAARHYATTLPFVRPDASIIVGQSAGGWGTVGYDSLPHPRDVTLVSMAGGRGGRKDDIANNHCGPAALIAAAGVLGQTARTPMLWIYTANDTFFDPALAAAMHAAFTASGGPATLLPLGPFRRDGHALFTGAGGSAIWGPLVERYMAGRPGGTAP